MIRPEIRQSLATDTTNLKFEWYYNSASDQFKGDLVSTADTVAIRIDPADKKFSYNHYLRFYIHDTQTGASYLFPVKLKVAKPYDKQDWERWNISAIGWRSAKMCISKKEDNI